MDYREHLLFAASMLPTFVLLGGGGADACGNVTPVRVAGLY